MSVLSHPTLLHHPIQVSLEDFQAAKFAYFSMNITEERNTKGELKKKLTMPLNWQTLTHDRSEGWINYNQNSIGIVTGRNSCIFVIDWDLGKDTKTDALYHHLVQTHGEPDTFRVLTGNNGVHWYFRLPSNLAIKSTTDLKANDNQQYKVDVRGDGGCIVAPFSFYKVYGKLSHKYYLPKTPLSELKEAPEWIFELFPSLLTTYYVQPVVENKYIQTNIVSYANNQLEDLLSCFTVERATSYVSWRNVAFALHSCDPNALQLFLQWSSQAENYSDTSCVKLWDSCKLIKGGYTIASLRQWAYQDNPSSYKLWCKTYMPFQPIPISFTPDIEITSQFVPTEVVQRYLNSHRIIALQSNMCTGKTFALRPCLQQYERILVVYFRKTLEQEILRDWKPEGFVLYSDIKGPIDSCVHTRLIIQVESLARVRDQYDLVILDEIESTMTHVITNKLNSVTISTQSIWYSLVSQVQHAAKVIMMDATLQDDTVHTLFPKRKFAHETIKIQNTHASYSKVNVKVQHKINVGIHQVIQYLQEGKRVVVPTSSTRVAKRLRKMILATFGDDKLVELINAERTTEKKIDSDMWINYDCLIYTPSIIAGISFNEDHYDVLVALFTQHSIDVEMCFQMLCRIRKLRMNTMIIACPRDFASYIDTSHEAMNQYIEQQLVDNMDVGFGHLCKDGLLVDTAAKRVKRTKLYFAYRHVLKKQRLTQTRFTSYLITLLRSHGMNVDHEVDVEEEQTVSREFASLLKETKQEVKSDDAQLIMDAPDLRKEAYEQLVVKRDLTKTETYAVKKYELVTTFSCGTGTLTAEFISERSKHVKAYARMKSFVGKTLEESVKHCRDKHEDITREDLMRTTIRGKVEETEEDGSSEDEICSEIDISKRLEFWEKGMTNRLRKVDGRAAAVFLMYNKTYLRQACCFEILQAAGFTTMNSKERIALKWNDLVKYLKDHYKEIATLWDTSLKLEYETEILTRQRIIMSVNKLLSNTLCVTLHRLKGKIDYTYVIKSLFDD